MEIQNRTARNSNGINAISSSRSAKREEQLFKKLKHLMFEEFEIKQGRNSFWFPKKEESIVKEINSLILWFGRYGKSKEGMMLCIGYLRDDIQEEPWEIKKAYISMYRSVFFEEPFQLSF